MPDHPSLISGTFRRPFAEQVAFFRQKLGNLVPTARWDDLIGAAHDRAFMVAGAAKADLLSDLAAAVERTISEGKSLDAFRKDFRAIVERHGWHGWTGEGSAAGRAWRTRIIYRTNARTSYAAGRNAQLAEGGFEYLVYKHGGSLEPRPEHLDLDGTTLPADHPFWQIYSTPNGWGCSCFIVGARSEAGARRLGGDPSKTLPEGWDSAAPPGIDEGWDYRPGASVQQSVRTMAAKTQQWDYTLAKAYMQGVPTSVRDDLAVAYRALPSVADDTRRYAQRIIEERQNVEIQRYPTLGLATSSQASTVRAVKGIDVQGFDFAIDPSAVRHIRSAHGAATVEASRGQRAVTAADYARLPSLLNEAGAFKDAGRSWRSNLPLLEVVREVDGERWHLFFEVRGGRRMLALDTWYIVGRSEP